MEFFNAIKSVMAAFVGVQKKKNLEDDFTKKSATPFIVAGVLMAIIFVVSIYTVVQLILP
ncbi:DUF2970 domain-containing protein [Leucothrix arctica]|uniref:DUF2970 domain-containing protein n=1 Tax=Leucothrix arctica TaxID=1481894 RepID=A0A317CKT4_9GAMM|nr:DUF2970 domain-containing protein [Leucothrix arctica]PWQ98949.1 hypothetical protein DKT75_01955 [Leucothrix arctica]